MPARYDAWEARQRLGKKLAKIPTLAWLAQAEPEALCQFFRPFIFTLIVQLH